MSVHSEVSLDCDALPYYGCGAQIFAHTGVKARAEAREDGWLVSQPGGKDYCPRHRDPESRPS